MNQPQFDVARRCVVAGYGILQPRIATPLPVPEQVTPFHWLFAGQCGIDPYSVTTSEVYQDLFEEGTFTGKGLLHVNALHRVLSGRLPDGQVLSHDLIEGSIARCGGVSDVTLIEDAPLHVDVADSRVHRWTRGDWQLLPLLLRAKKFRAARDQPVEDHRQSAPFARRAAVGRADAGRPRGRQDFADGRARADLRRVRRRRAARRNRGSRSESRRSRVAAFLSPGVRRRRARGRRACCGTSCCCCSMRCCSATRSSRRCIAPSSVGAACSSGRPQRSRTRRPDTTSPVVARRHMPVSLIAMALLALVVVERYTVAAAEHRGVSVVGVRAIVDLVGQSSATQASSTRN